MKSQEHFSISRRSAISVISGVGAHLLAPIAFAQRPQPASPAATAYQDADWRDESRNRSIPIRLRWPATPAPTGGWPVIIHSHGLGGSRAGGAVWGEAWAQAGFVVLHVQHPGSDTSAIPMIRSGGVSVQWFAEQLIQRLRDVRFAIDEIERQSRSGGRWAQADLNRIGVSGHSYGAHTTLGIAGQRYPFAQGFTEGMPDPRVKAFIALSPNPPKRGAERAFGAITRPVLLITGTQDGDVIGDGSTPEGRQTVYGHLPRGNKAMLVLDGADHMTFGGGTGASARSERESDRIHFSRVAAISTDWWRWKLQGDQSGRDRLAKPPGLQPADIWLLDA